MKTLFLSSFLTLATVASSQAASFLEMLPNPMISCSTSSNGYSFSDQSRDPSLARSQAISHCQAHSSTNNSECAANVSCNDGSYYPPMVACTTSSNGYDFSDESRDSSLARSQTISQCQAHDSTNNSECLANVECIDERPQHRRPMVTCSTSSNGYNFSDRSRDASLARSQSISQCQIHDSTNSSECLANVYCDDGGYYAPITTCGTTSNGYNFSDQSRDVNLARSQATEQCQAHVSTNNEECMANITCNDGSSYPPMITCSTSSNDFYFSDQSRDPSLARSQAIGQCQTHGSTNNEECAANVECRVSH